MKWILDIVLSLLNVAEVKELVLSLVKKLVESTETEWDDKVYDIIVVLLNGSEKKGLCGYTPSEVKEMENVEGKITNPDCVMCSMRDVCVGAER